MKSSPFFEPINTLTHLVAALFSLVGLGWLLWLAWGEWGKWLALLVYGLSLIALFTASSLLHGAKVDEKARMWLNRLDHAAIFLLIAGTYTPIIHHFADANWRWPILGLVWGVASAGMGHKFVSRRIHGFLNVSIYLLLSWGGAIPLFLALNLASHISRPGLLLLLVGGLIYTIGFVVYYWQWPDPRPGLFGHHEIWHLFVIGGSLCHYLFMLLFIAL